MKIFGYEFLNEASLNKKIDAEIQKKLLIDTPQSDYGSSMLKLGRYHVWELIGKLRNLQQTAKEKYNEYRFMEQDSTIQTALEFYSDDATQVDNRTNKIVAIKSDDKMIESDLNAFLSSVDVNRRIWNWAYNVCEFGDWFVRIKIDPDSKELQLDDDTDPGLIMDLYEHGKRVGFVEEDTSEYRVQKHKTNPHNLELIMHGPDSFVHIMIHKSAKYDSVELPVPEKVDEHGDHLVKKYTVVRGTSMLEPVRAIYRIINLLEDSLLAARIAKAEYIRIFNIEVGNSTPNTTTDIINRVKSMFDSKASFDTNSGRYQSVKMYRPFGDPVFNPVRNGNGAISHDVIGGDIDVKDLADIDYFQEKLFSGLKIPAAYFNVTDTLPGGLGDNTLTRQDIRYSHTIKRVQNALVEGVRDLCGIWLLYNGRDYDPDKFQVIIKDSSEIERLAEMTELKMKLETILDSVRGMQEMFGDKGLNIGVVYKAMIDQYIDNPDLLKVIDEELDKAIENLKKVPVNTNPDEDDGFGGFSDRRR